MSLKPSNAATEKQGYAPAYQTVSDFQMGEVITVNGIVKNAIELLVPLNAPARKIYGWLWCNNTNSNYYVKGVIEFWKNGSIAGNLPLCIGGGSFTAPLVSVCVAGGSQVQDSIGVYLGSLASGQPSNLLLQPLYIFGNFDKLTFSVNEKVNVNNIRAFLACISSQ